MMEVSSNSKRGESNVKDRRSRTTSICTNTLLLHIPRVCSLRLYPAKPHTRAVAGRIASKIKDADVGAYPYAVRAAISAACP